MPVQCELGLAMRRLISPIWNIWRGAALTVALLAVFFFSNVARPQSQNQELRPAQEPAPLVSLAPAAKPDAKKAKEAYREALRAEQEEDWQTAYEKYSEAVRWAPNDREYLLMRAMARSHLVQIKMDTAERDAISGHIAEARQQLLAASYLDPLNSVIRERMVELAVAQAGKVRKSNGPAIAGEVHLAYQAGKHNLDYRGDTQGAYEELARQFGVEVAFDVDLHPRTVRVRLDDVDFLTAARLLGDMTATFWRPLTPRLFFVTDNTPQKRRDYEPSLVRTILLPASQNQDQMTELLRVVRDITGVMRSELNASSHTLTLRASPRAIAVASDLIEDLEKPVGELILEIEILEVDRNYARQLGIIPPQTSQVFSISSQQIQQAELGGQSLINVINQIFGLPASVSGMSSSQLASLVAANQLGIGSLLPPVVAFGGGMTTFLATLPGATANFATMLSMVKQGRRVLLRAEDGQPVTFFVGDRIPVSLATYSASMAGTGASVPGVGQANFPTTNYPAGKSPSAIVAAYFHDKTTTSIVDLAVANRLDGTISIFQGNGDGTFQTPGLIQLPAGFEPAALAAYDFNGDGHQDLAVAGTNTNTKAGAVMILLGNGDGTFQAPAIATAGNTPVALAVANFHNAVAGSNVDLAVANQADSSITVFSITTSGVFSASPGLLQLPAGFAPTGLAAMQFTGSGHPDLAVADAGNNSVSVFLGNGNGTFQPRADYATGNTPVFVATGDFNGDGIMDLAIANDGAPTTANTGDTVSILLGNASAANPAIGNGTFSPGTQRDFPAGNSPTAIAVGDYNIDGISDLVVSDEADNAVSVLLGQGGGFFGPNFELPVDQAPVSIATADFNGDGKADIATANQNSNDATVILNSSSFVGPTNPLAGIPFPGIEYIDVGLKIKATPRIHPDNDVSLELNFDISSLTSQNYNSIPVISNEAVKQTVRVRENKTAALAGFLQSQVTNAITGSPGIAGLPGVGWLGQNENVQNQDQELLILVTPRLVRYMPRENHTIYAGQGALEGTGAGIIGGGLRPATPETNRPAPAPPPQQQPPQPVPQPPPAQR